MAQPNIRNFEGQSWSALAKCIDKDIGTQKKVSFLSDTPQSNSISLNIEDIGIYGKYPCAEPFILAVCGYCGDRFKVAALARHIATKHPDGKSDLDKIKSDTKNPISILKKHKLRSRKEVKEKEPVASTSHSSSVKLNKQPSKVLIQVDRRRVHCSTNREPLLISRNHGDEQNDHSSIDIIKTEKEICPKNEVTKVKKPKDDQGYNNYQQSSPSKLIVNVTTTVEHPESNTVSRKERSDCKKLKTTHIETEILDKENIKVQEQNAYKSGVLPLENGVSDSNTNNETGTENRKRKITPTSRTYNPDRHCGVVGKENSKPCTRSLTCKSHTMSLRRAVRGRSKNFDQLLADHRAEKEKSKQSDVSRDSTISSNAINTLQLTPIKIPLVLNPHLTKVETVKDVINFNHLPNKSLNGVKINCDINSDIIHNMNKLNHFQSNRLPRKKVKKRKKKRKLGSIKKCQVKFFHQWHPWYRRTGGMLYTQNNLPTFASMNENNATKKSKATFIDKKEYSRYHLNAFRNLNFNDSNSIRNQLKPNEDSNKDLSTDFRLQCINAKNATSVQVYSLEDVKDVYFKLIPENKFASVLKIQNESLAITFPPSSLSLLTNSLNSDNQFLVQKKRDYPFIHKYIQSYNNSDDSSSESDGDDFISFDEMTDIRYSMMEPVGTSKEVSYNNHISLNSLSGNPLRLHRFLNRSDERNFSLGVGTLSDGQVSLETTKRLHFVTPSGPTAVSLKQYPIDSEGSYDIVKSLIEE